MDLELINKIGDTGLIVTILLVLFVYACNRIKINVHEFIEAIIIILILIGIAITTLSKLVFIWTK